MQQRRDLTWWDDLYLYTTVLMIPGGVAGLFYFGLFGSYLLSIASGLVSVLGLELGKSFLYNIEWDAEEEE